MGFPGIPDPYTVKDNDGAEQNIKRPSKGRSRTAGSMERGCANCALRAHWPNLRTPQMPVEGSSSADVLVLGEAPGEIEDLDGKPFVGPTGRLLRPLLPMRWRDRIAYTNMTRCRPPANRTPTAAEVHACSVHLEETIEQGNFKAILGLGSAPLSRFIQGTGIQAMHGLKFPVRIGSKILWYWPSVHPAYVLHTAEERGGRADTSPVYPILEVDLQNFFGREARDGRPAYGLDTWPAPKIEEVNLDDVIWVKSEAEARALTDKLYRDKPIGLDIETDNLRPNAQGAGIMTAAVSDGRTTVAWPIYHPEAPNAWGLPLLLRIASETRWVAHSAGFELAWLQEGAQQLNLAWEPRRGFDCSLVAARLYQRRHTALNLGILTRLYMGVDIKALSTIDVARVRQTRLETVIPYNGLDALGSFRVFDAIGDKVDPDNYAQLIETIESVTAMQLQGLDVSQEAAHRLYEQWQGRAVAAARQAETVHEVRQYVRDTQVEFRIGSDEQLGQVLTKYSFLPLPRNKDGSFKVDDSTINALAPDHPLCRLAIDHRHSRKMAATYVLPYIEARTKNADGRIHPSYSVALTRTYRTSAEDPSIQNFPHRVDNEIREPVVAPPGKIFAAFDFSSLEARVYGMASKDRNLCRSLINGLDIHYKWLDRALELYPPYIDRLAKRVYPNETFEQIRKGGRDGVIKSDLVFASFFGVSAKSVSARTDIPLEIVYDILSEFWTEYPEAANWIKTQRKLYRETGTAVDLFNRERYAILWGNEPLNLCVQGTAARLVLEAQNELYKLSKKERDDNLCPKINIHDDLVFSIDDASTPVLMDYIREIARIMCRPRHRFQTVPMAVDCRVGYNWADLHSCYKHTGTYH